MVPGVTCVPGDCVVVFFDVIECRLPADEAETGDVVAANIGLAKERRESAIKKPTKPIRQNKHMGLVIFAFKIEKQTK